MSSVVLITGGSSGIGLCTARRLAARGHQICEFSRSGQTTDNIFHITADISDPVQVTAAVDEVIRLYGHIDILICNAGFGISGALEFTTPAAAKALLDVNLFGVANIVTAVLPHMRRQKSGRIVAVSSVGAVAALPFQGWYSVSKAAVNTYILALRNEIRPFGITACAVMPGDICTGFTAARQKSHTGDDIYSGRISRSVSRMERDEQQGMAPDAAARVLCRAALKRRVPPLCSAGLLYKLICLLLKLLPGSLANRIIGLLYAK